LANLITPKIGRKWFFDGWVHCFIMTGRFFGKSTIHTRLKQYLRTATMTTLPLADVRHTRQREFLNGVKDTFPLILGAIPFGIIFGATAVLGGLTPLATVAMSLFVFAGSSQFIGANLFSANTPVPVIIVTTFIVNLRHALYSATLAPYLRGVSQKWLLPLGFWLTDETFALVARRYPQEDGSPYKHWYQLGSSVAMYSNWQVCTWIGIVAGTSLQGIANLGLDFAMVVTFMGIVVPLIITRPMFASAVTAGVVAVLANGLPNKMGLMLAAIAGIMAGVIVEQRTKAKK
jgi:4-azaleucine resistance transporter AzlC